MKKVDYYFAFQTLLSIISAIAVYYYGIGRFSGLAVLPKPNDFVMHINNTINEKLSSKANYDYGNEVITIPKECHILHTETVQRHGARHLNKVNKIEKIVDYFTKLGNEGIFKNSVLLDWAIELRDREMNNTGKICQTGVWEQMHIGERLRKRIALDENFNGDIIIENTFKHRTQQSRDAFLQGLLPKNYPKENLRYKEAYQCEAVQGESGVNRTVYESYAPLRFFSICPNYLAYKQNEDLHHMIDESFENSDSASRMTGVNKIWRTVMDKPATVDKETKLEVLKKMYLMCQFEASCYNDYNRTCGLLLQEPSFLKDLDNDDDVHLFGYKGDANPLNSKMSCPLAKSIVAGIAANMLADMKNAVKKAELIEKYDKYFQFERAELSRAHLRFGHAESILPLYYWFIMKPPRIQSNRMRFSGHDFIPMSANFQIDLMECDGDYFFEFLANETPIAMDLPNYFEAKIYKVEDWLEQWKYILEMKEMENCMYEDFEQICGVPSC